MHMPDQVKLHRMASHWAWQAPTGACTHPVATWVSLMTLFWHKRPPGPQPVGGAGGAGAGEAIGKVPLPVVFMPMEPGEGLVGRLKTLP